MGKNVLLAPGGYMAKRAPSKSLEKALLAFAAKSEEIMVKHKDQDDVFVLHRQSAGGIDIKQEIKIGQEDYVCYTLLPIDTSVERQDLSLDFFRLVNGINTQLDYGNFEFCEETVALRYRTHYKPDGDVALKTLHLLINYPLHIIDKYKAFL